MKKEKRASSLWWLLPLALALPFLGGMTWMFVHMQDRVNELINVAVKLVVVP